MMCWDILIKRKIPIACLSEVCNLKQQIVFKKIVQWTNTKFQNFVCFEILLILSELIYSMVILVRAFYCTLIICCENDFLCICCSTENWTQLFTCKISLPVLHTSPKVNNKLNLLNTHMHTPYRDNRFVNYPDCGDHFNSVDMYQTSGCKGQEFEAIWWVLCQ